MNATLWLHAVVIGLLALVACVDARTMEIPDELNAALGICALISAAVTSDVSLAGRLIGAFCVSVPMALFCILIPGAFGGGDIKLVFAMGLYLGWRALTAGVFLGFLFGGIQAVYLLASGKAGKGAHMAFGPALCTGLILSVVSGQELVFWYLRLFD